MSGVQRWTLGAVCAATAILMLDIAVVNTALSNIAADLHTGLSGLQWVIDAYTLALASVVLTAGALADQFGRRRLFVGGLVLFTAMSAVCAAAPSIEVLDAARAVQGIGAAVMFAVSLALLANAFPDERERAGALAAYGATIGASFAIGPLVGGALTSGLGWRWVFLINLPIGVACLAVTRTKLVESRDPNARKVDLPGQALLVAGLFTLVLGLLRGNDDGWGSPGILALLIGAVVMLAGFVAVEARSAEPMMPLGLFRRGSFAGAQVAAFAVSGSQFAVFLYFTLYLQQVLGLSAIQAGLVYVPGTMLNLLAAAATPQLAARVPPGRIIAMGLLLSSIGLLLTTALQPDSSWTVLLPGLFISMLGVGILNPTLAGVALDVPERQSGLAAGINDTARQAGIAVGVAGLGALIPSSAGLGAGRDGGASFVHGLHHALVAGSALALIGAVACALLIRTPAPGSGAPAAAQPASA